MSLSINTNIAAMSVQRNFDATQSALATSLQRLSSGLRITTARDDPAGLTVSSRMTAQINGLSQASRNANDGVSLAQTAEAALSTSSDILLRIRDLAVQASDGTNSASDREALNTEVQSLKQELQSIAINTEYNGKKLIDGSLASLLFQVGANTNQTISFGSGNFQTGSYGNNRIGGLAAYTTGGIGDLLAGTRSAANSALGDALLLSGGSGDTSAVNGASAKNDFTLTTSLGRYDVTYRTGASAEEIASEVNRLDSGVRASALTEVVLGDGAGSAGVGRNFQQNSTYAFRIATDTTGTAGTAPDASTVTTISFTTGGTTGNVNSSTQLAAAAQAFNDAAGTTGFTAEVVKTDDNDWALKLSNQTGKDLRIENVSDNVAKVISVSDISVLDSNPATTTQPAQTYLSVRDSSVDWVAGQGSWYTGRVIFDATRSFSITTSSNTPDVFGESGVGIAGTYASQPQQTATLDVSTYDAAQRSLATVDSALAAINDQRARYGAIQARFEFSISNLSATSDNLSAARSRIQDTDFAKEVTAMARSQILQQAGAAMLAQANQGGSYVLSLLKTSS